VLFLVPFWWLDAKVLDTNTPFTKGNLIMAISRPAELIEINLRLPLSLKSNQVLDQLIASADNAVKNFNTHLKVPNQHAALCDSIATVRELMVAETEFLRKDNSPLLSKKDVKVKIDKLKEAWRRVLQAKSALISVPTAEQIQEDFAILNREVIAMGEYIDSNKSILAKDQYSANGVQTSLLNEAERFHATMKDAVESCQKCSTTFVKALPLYVAYYDFVISEFEKTNVYIRGAMLKLVKYVPAAEQQRESVQAKVAPQPLGISQSALPSAAVAPINNSHSSHSSNNNLVRVMPTQKNPQISASKQALYGNNSKAAQEQKVAQANADAAAQENNPKEKKKGSFWCCGGNGM
jgi:hypothetical protein